ncbi:putative triosephosphate isomerase [Colletotrichum spaethianum]|uniref:Triosephosphate isomerase n=1 Tax=Colletotrichum spaethianum TaxID=700344 RepID=A0AA37L3B5_9PEZI|nr:putative triosephosphate isomerase [Colletotrichum spaethianum]GKT41216.1 putative triosephosphate isomerase [Colletotrichum spaethianum]
MYLSHAQTQAYLDALIDTLAETPHLSSKVDVFLLVDHVSLAAVVSRWKASPHNGSLRLRIGAQDASPEDRGAFTGQVSAAVLAEVGCEMVMVGHAERRRMFGEDDGLVARKAAAVARNGMVPLVCVGEAARSEAGGAEAAIAECSAQVEAVMRGVPEEGEVVLAYEPVWAIGAAEPAAAEYVVAVAQGIREMECVRLRRGAVRVVYGGSAGPGMFEGVKDGVDGLFMARFGLDVGVFGRVAGEVASA